MWVPKGRAGAPQGGGRTFTSASYRQGVVSMGTELGGGGLVTPASLKVAQDGMRRVLAAANASHNGKFLNYGGEQLSW